jgi:6-methylsalicylate decarboxylase
MRWFDVHAHALPGDGDDEALGPMQELVAQEGFAGPAPGLDWSVDAALRFMDQRGIEMQLLSLPTPLDPGYIRRWNDYVARIVADHPQRFGLLAALPMAHPDLAVAEIDHALNDLHADGFSVVSNYAGRYLGSPHFASIYESLNECSAVVFVHPTLEPGFEHLGLGRPGPLIEYPVDTARTAVDAVFAGIPNRYAKVRFILAHAGGVLPILQDRIALLGPQGWVDNPLALTDHELRQQLSAFYLDTAIAGDETLLAAAIRMVGEDHVLFGTDYAPAGDTTIDASIKQLTQSNDVIRPARMHSTFATLFPAAAMRARHSVLGG